MSRDLIDRQEIINALDHVIKNGAKNKYFDGHFITAEAMKEYILAQPSAQPDPASCKQVTGKLDLINRQDAIDAIVKCTNCNTPKDLREYVAEHNLRELWSGGVLEALEAVEGLPSAPLYTPDEIQTMQDLEWSQMEKMYELGKEEAMQRTQMSLTEPCEHCQEFDCYGCQFRPIIREKVMPNE